jgi:hypothetical protein
MKRSALAGACLVALSLAGCGGSAPKVVALGPVGVFTSAQDCAASEKLKLSDCSILIQQALQIHQQTAKTYISARLCEETEGADRCERTDNNAFRPKLLAFMITFTPPPGIPTSAPLYATKEKDTVGFTTGEKGKTLLAVDETLTFSTEAKFVAEGYVTKQ